MYLVITYLVMFVCFTTAHLYGSAIKRDSLRAPTKTIILLSILGMYLEWMHMKGVEPSALLVFALITSWLGDVFLIPKGVKWFTIGGIFFWISHFLFIFTYCESSIIFSDINPVLIVLIVLLYGASVCILFNRLKACLPKALFVPMLLYLFTNGTMNVFAWFRFLGGNCTVLSGLMTAIGALLFFASDSSLFLVRFDKNSRLKTHFIVMLTYSLGEFLIVLGLMLNVL